MMQRHSVILVSAALAATFAAGHMHTRSVKRTKNAKLYGRHDSGLYHMPGQMMTKAGKRAQMQHDFATCNRRRGRPR